MVKLRSLVHLKRQAEVLCLDAAAQESFFYDVYRRGVESHQKRCGRLHILASVNVVLSLCVCVYKLVSTSGDMPWVDYGFNLLLGLTFVLHGMFAYLALRISRDSKLRDRNLKALEEVQEVAHTSRVTYMYATNALSHYLRS
jgi:hypothetical protein